MISREPIFLVKADLAEITEVGATPYGGRRVIEILGGTVAAPAFAEIAGIALRYLDVPPDALVADGAAATDE